LLNLIATNLDVVFGVVNLNGVISVCGVILQHLAGALPWLGSGNHGFGYNYLDVAGMAASGALPIPNPRLYSQGLIFTSPLLVVALLLYPLGLIGSFASLRFRVFSFGLIAILCAAIWIYILLSYGVPIPAAPYFEVAGGVTVSLSKFINPILLTQSKPPHSNT